MGIEQPRLAALWPLHKDDASFTPTEEIVEANGTPNQRFLGGACALAWSRRGKAPIVTPRAAVAQLYALFSAMAEQGHQCVSKTGFDSNEQGACDPHAELWGGAMALILAEAYLQKLPALLADAIGWWADHFALCDNFWITGKGVVMPCARAIPTSGHGEGPVHPSFVWDSRAYALVILGQDGQHAQKTYGNIPPPAENAFQILRDCSSQFGKITSQHATTKLKLATPIRLWKLAGGYDAAYVADSPQIDSPCGWVTVAPDGSFIGDKLISTFKVPPGTPVIVGGSQEAVKTPVAPQPAAVTATISAPTDPQSSKQRSGLWGRFMAWLESL
jgi:hypothetical protein